MKKLPIGIQTFDKGIVDQETHTPVRSDCGRVSAWRRLHQHPGIFGRCITTRISG